MAISNLSKAIVVISSLMVIRICWARIPFEQEYLIPQNIARAAVNLPPLVWNETVAQFARSYAKERAGDCNLQHSDTQLYGENIAMSPAYLSPTSAAELWVGEKPNYDYASNKCKDMCGHYTQVVWRDTTSVGCASVKCHNGGTFVTCNYYPPGNWVGAKPF